MSSEWWVVGYSAFPGAGLNRAETMLSVARTFMSGTGPDTVEHGMAARKAALRLASCVI